MIENKFIDLSTVALFIADTRDHQLAVNTILHCKKEINFGQTIFLTDKVGHIEGIDLFTIQPIMSKDDYSNIILFNLLNKIKKDITHILIVQTDGYIVNPKSWRQEFLDYDYIGAPWKYHPNNNEPPFPQSTPENCVGNGGFNLRSVKLIQKVEELLNKNTYEKNKIYTKLHGVNRIVRGRINRKESSKTPRKQRANYRRCTNHLYRKERRSITAIRYKNG